MNQLAIRAANRKECKDKVNKICDNYLDFSHSPIMTTKATENKSEDTFDEQTDGNEDIVDRGHRAGVWRQMFTLFWRAYLILIRNPLLLKVRFMRSLVLALFLGAIYYKQSPNSSDVENINAALFLVIQNTMFMNTLFCIQIFCLEGPIFLREYKNRLYGVFPYFVSTTFIQLPVITLTGIIFIAVIYYMVGFNPELPVFFTCYFISAINKTMMGALAMFTPMVMPMMLFGGLFLNSGNMPGWLSWIQYLSFIHYGYESLYLSFIHYGYESLVVNQWKDIDYIPCLNNSESSGQCYANGLAVIEDNGFTESALFYNPVIMLVMTAVFLFMTYIGLVIKTKRK
ncbi:unnamed protein product [Oppiella nova]|uniref:ABC-2 type transporter transmembrane domain-containing protein n=1 Tax=Oppiella nova TaxID=334625 RepID=A0A7R9LBK6_9ACAR|nr:unnamed protein product [Oppiella nova]CAG2161870.1 unnamed protein product [Oppiella nova]